MNHPDHVAVGPASGTPPVRRFARTGPLMLCLWICVAQLSAVRADESFKRDSSWQRLSTADMADRLRADLDQMGVVPAVMDATAESFLQDIEVDDADPVDAYVDAIAGIASPIGDLVTAAIQQPVRIATSIDPSQEGYAAIASLPDTTRMTVRTYLGRRLVRDRLYDEALPVIAEIDPVKSIDPATALFYRGVCYHGLRMKKETLADLRRLLENQDDAPVRFARTAAMMIADIEPLKEDTLDEISRMMTDVTRRLDLGRAGETVEKKEQEIIDKLTKLIDQIEQQQQQQQQQQSQGGGGSQGGEPSGGLAESQAAGGPQGKGDVDRKKLDEGPAWGNLPPAERQETIQQISRDLPTHYREAIEAYFRKLATDPARG